MRGMREKEGSMDPTTTRRRFLQAGGAALLAAATGTGVLDACGGVGRDERTLDYWAAIVDAENDDFFVDQYVARFERQHPGYSVDVSFKPGANIDQSIQTALAGGHGPDLIPSPGPSYVLSYVENGQIAPLDGYARQHGWKDLFLPWALETGKVKGKLYSLPTSYETMVIFYNTRLFEEKGWAPPKSRDDLERLCQDCVEQGILPFTASNSAWRAATEWFVTAFLNHLAGPDVLYGALTGRRRWTDPLIVESIDLMNTWFQKGWFGGGIEKYFTGNFDYLYAQLAKGRAAMDMEGTWAFTNLRTYFSGEDAYGWVPVPPLRDGVPSPLFELAIGGTISINANAPDKDLGARWLDWQNRQKDLITRQMAELADEPPPVYLSASDFPRDINPNLKNHYLAIDAATAKGDFGYTTWTFWPPKSDTYVYEEMEKVLTRQMTPKEYCAGLDQVFRQELKEGAVPPLPSRETSS